MHDLIVADRQDKVLAERIEEAEGQLVVVPLAEERIGGHIAEHIVHPAHIPLEVETEPAIVRRLCNHRPSGTLLSDHQSAGHPLKDGGVQLAQKGECLEVLVAAVFVGTPFAAAAVIV